MKRISTVLLAAGLAALSACGGGAETNVAANNSSDALYNVVPEDLNLLGNDLVLDNGLGDLNAVDANAVDANSTTNGL
jgi:poly-gamma-glutamate capsule biosynthesis protein CapA/YwtB (metallophosphatase superfamily)